MSINEAGKDGSFGQVEHFGASRRGGVGRDGNNSVALNEDEHVVERLVGLAVNEVTGSNGDGLFRSSRSCFLLSIQWQADRQNGCNREQGQAFSRQHGESSGRRA